MSKKNKVVRLGSKDRSKGKSYMVTYNGQEMTRAERESMIRAAQSKQPAVEQHKGKKAKKGTKVAEPSHSKLFNLLHPNRKQTVVPDLKSVDVSAQAERQEKPVAKEKPAKKEKPARKPEKKPEEPVLEVPQQEEVPVSEPVLEVVQPEPEVVVQEVPVEEVPVQEAPEEEAPAEPAPEAPVEVAPEAPEEPVQAEPVAVPEEPVVETAEVAPEAPAEPVEEAESEEEDDASQEISVKNAKKRISPAFVKRVGKTSGKSCDENVAAQEGLKAQLEDINSQIAKAKTPKAASDELKAELNEKRKALRAQKKEVEKNLEIAIQKAVALEHAADGYCDIYKLLTGEELSVRKTARINEYRPLTEEQEQEVLNSLWANKGAHKS